MPEKLPSRKIILQHFDMRDSVMARVIHRVGPFKLSRNMYYFRVFCKAINGRLWYWSVDCGDVPDIFLESAGYFACRGFGTQGWIETAL